MSEEAPAVIQPQGASTPLLIRQITARAMITAWIVVAGYFGAAGWARSEIEEVVAVAGAPEGAVNCGKITFKSAQDCLRFQRNAQMESLFPWISRIPALFGLILLGFGFGSLGGSMRALGEELFMNVRLTALRAFDLPVFGGLLGVLVLGVAYLIPAAVTINESALRPTALIFLAMVAGAFSFNVFSSVERQVAAIFPRPSSDKKDS
jgi:hypothetical protein